MEKEFTVTEVEETPISKGESLEEIKREYDKFVRNYNASKSQVTLGTVLGASILGGCVIGGVIAGIQNNDIGSYTALGTMAGGIFSGFGWIIRYNGTKWLPYDKEAKEQWEKRYNEALTQEEGTKCK